MRRLSNDNLMRLSQVSFWWRGIAIGTPMLWSTITINMRQWGSGGGKFCRDAALGLISLSLERGGNWPLKIKVEGGATFSDVRVVLEKLIQQSSRWREVVLSMTAPAFGLLSTANGNLPRLESLHLSVMGEGSLPTEADVFETAPQLIHLTIQGQTSNIPVTLPWPQLRIFKYFGGVAKDLPDALYLLSRLSLGAKVDFETRVSDAHLSLDLNPVVCEASFFLMTLKLEDDVDHARFRLVCADILAHLTLPNVSAFYLNTQSPCLLVPNALHDLVSRSSFDSNLTILQLSRVAIPAKSLLQLLSGVPRLRELYICDLPASGPENLEQVIITDLFLISLTSVPDAQPLVPDLRVLSLTSLLRFHDDILLDLITSRVFSCGEDEMPFWTDLLWLPGHERELDRSCRKQLSELVCQDKLAFNFEMDDGT
jgi:hypothetical protein